MINVFIPHRWNSDDHDTIAKVLDRTKFSVKDYSVTPDKSLPSIDGRYKVDPKIKAQISHASVVICSNRVANNNGIAIDEIRYAVSIGKPVVAIKVINSTSSEISSLGINIIANRKDSVEAWLYNNVH